jgi:sulfotransferase
MYATTTYEKFIGLAGLPRSGSTLLSAILGQNPDIHAEGNSAVCQLMWEVQQTCLGSAREQLSANRRINTYRELCANIPATYYKHISNRIVIDKCRGWHTPANLQMLCEYTAQDPRIIVLERPLAEVVRSFIHLQKINNQLTNQAWLERKLLDDDQPDPITVPYKFLSWAKANNHGNFLFISYDQIVNQTNLVLDKIYDFIDEPRFAHDLTNIQPKFVEDDNVYFLPGMHDIRSTISTRTIDIELTDACLKRIEQLENMQ